MTQLPSDFTNMNSHSNSQSPCVRNCCLNEDDICVGCFRSLEEIKCWSQLDPEQQQAIYQKAEQRRRDNIERYTIKR